MIREADVDGPDLSHPSDAMCLMSHCRVRWRLLRQLSPRPCDSRVSCTQKRRWPDQLRGVREDDDGQVRCRTRRRLQVKRWPQPHWACETISRSKLYHGSQHHAGETIQLRVAALCGALLFSFAVSDFEFAACFCLHVLPAIGHGQSFLQDDALFTAQTPQLFEAAPHRWV